MSNLHLNSGYDEMLSSLKKDLSDITEKEIQKVIEFDEDSMIAIANKYRIIKNYPKSFIWMEEVAGQGNSKAQLELAKMYFDGIGVPKDDQQALECCLEAAMQGNSDAQYLMGELYKDGIRVPKNIDTAIEWFTKAANQGDHDAQFILGDIYENEVKDLQKAVTWYKMSDHGNKRVKSIITRLNNQGYYPGCKRRISPTRQSKSTQATKKTKINTEKDQDCGLLNPPNSKNENGDSVIKQILKKAGDALELELKRSKMENEKLQQMLNSSEQQKIERETLLQQEISSLKQGKMEMENKIQKLKEFVGHL